MPGGPLVASGGPLVASGGPLGASGGLLGASGGPLDTSGGFQNCLKGRRTLKGLSQIKGFLRYLKLILSIL